MQIRIHTDKGEGGDGRHAGKSVWDLGFASFAELLAGLL